MWGCGVVGWEIGCNRYNSGGCLFGYPGYNQLIIMNELKEILPYTALADNLEPSNLLLAFYLRKYSADKAHKIYQNFKAQNSPVAQEIYPILDQMIKKNEEISKALGSQLDPKTNMQELMTYTEKIFLFADDQYRAGRISPELTQNFQTAWRFYEVVGSYAKLSEDQDKRRLYAKAKAIEVHKRLKEGGGNFQQPQQNQQYQQPQQQQQQQQKPVPANTPNFNNKKKLDPERVHAQQSATVEIQNAISELSFNRVGYAKENLRKALMLLERF